jgi:hypothetical protein
VLKGADGVLKVFVVVAVLASVAAATSQASLDGKLYLLAFGGDDVVGADVAKAGPELRARLEAFIARRGAFRSRIAARPGDSPEQRDLAETRRRTERAIVGLIAATDVESDAARFAREVPLAWEYEGRPDGALAEASFAEDFLKKNPQTPIAPYLYVFIAARQRVAFEAYAQRAAPPAPSPALEGMKAAAKKYRTFMQRARSQGDPLIAAIAEDVDRQPQLHVKADTHPRDFDPDT